VLNVLDTPSVNQIREDVENAKFVSAISDSSDHKHTKLILILCTLLCSTEGSRN
jgi:hypothetical protein